MMNEPESSMNKAAWEGVPKKKWKEFQKKQTSHVERGETTVTLE